VLHTINRFLIKFEILKAFTSYRKPLPTIKHRLWHIVGVSGVWLRGKHQLPEASGLGWQDMSASFVAVASCGTWILDGPDKPMYYSMQMTSVS